MIVCSCRNISDKSYKTKEELTLRLLQDDRVCSNCIDNLEKKEEDHERLSSDVHTKNTR
jgi:hypothetical protein